MISPGIQPLPSQLGHVLTSGAEPVFPLITAILATTTTPSPRHVPHWVRMPPIGEGSWSPAGSGSTSSTGLLPVGGPPVGAILPPGGHRPFRAMMNARGSGRERERAARPAPARRARMDIVSRPNPRQGTTKKGTQAAAQTAALSSALAGAVDLSGVKARAEAANRAAAGGDLGG